MIIKPTTFVISDFHFYHENIIEYANRPMDFGELIVRKWNETNGMNDDVLFLGDLTFKGKELTKRYTDKLWGNKYMLLGNHDNKSVSWYQDCGFIVINPVYKTFVNSKGKFPTLITHEPVQDLPKGWFNIHGHIHGGTHREYPLTERHFNVSCEPLGYKPIQIFEIVSKWTIDK